MAAAAAIVPAINAVSSVIKSLLGGMAERAAQATSENEALAQVIQACYSAMEQVVKEYNSGDVNQQDSIASVLSIRQWYWQTITPHIQPNRNGCNSGQSCPSNNGTIPAGYCSGNVGASCCLGCWTIQAMFNDAVNAIQNGSGTVNVVNLNIKYKNFSGDIPAQQFVFIQPPLASDITGTVNNVVNSLLGTSSSPAGIASVGSSSTLIYILIAAVVLLVIISFRRRG